MVILSNKQWRDLNARLDRLDHRVQLQGEAHSAIMNQQAATQGMIRELIQGLHERLSFNRRPQP